MKLVWCAIQVCLVCRWLCAEKPVAHWQFDEGSGTVCADSSGNGNQGALRNGATWTAGRSGTALSLDGVNDYYFAPDSASLRGNDFTLSLWFRANRTQGVQRLLSKPAGTGSDNSYALYLHNGSLTFHTSSYSGAMQVGGFTAGFWRHVVVTKSGTTARLYLGGVEVRSAMATANVAYSARPVIVGAEDDNGDGRPEFFFDGTVDDVRIYNRVVSIAELQGTPPPPAVGDTVPPTVGVTAPANGSVVSGAVALAVAA
ncbi:MAG: LamG domain-containing protein, partial [Bryobacterales bacterium]|nr:LamG domain-containing protein [Bryobacterales bacterium]